MSTEWVLLTIAIACEVAGTTCLKLSDGFSRIIPSLLIFPCYVASFVALTYAVRVIPISVAYAVWSAAGTAAIAAIGIVVFREPATGLKLLFIIIIIFGVIGLHLADRLAHD